ncbi:hypothetical protein Glove_587g1 [Diversispora epigaea]|uniref:Uncharacterized protein n=1 Tax=Diversispora epigaea TaxID=1348612 RepID=A0A397GBD9_9GLOM|nr:hypothetical protein Glove_587g1 [Diversispora epigaea]
MIYYDTKTNSQIPQEMIQSLEKICGESIFNTLLKTQICYVHEDMGSVWNLDNFENGNGKKKRTKSQKRTKDSNNKDNNKNVIMVNNGNGIINGNHNNCNNNNIINNNYNEKSNNKHNNRIIEKRCSKSLDISRYNNNNRSIGNLDLLNKHNNNLDFIAGRYSIDVASERRSKNFDVNHVNHNKIGKMFGGAGGNKFEDNEMMGRYSIDVVRNGDVRGYVNFNSRVGNSDNGSNKENNGGKLRRVMSRMLKIKKKNGVR